MATVMLMEWPGVTEEQYNRVMSGLGLDAKPPLAPFFTSPVSQETASGC
jgi:hypothetical protein